MQVKIVAAISLLASALGASAASVDDFKVVRHRRQAPASSFYLSTYSSSRQTFAPEYLMYNGTVVPTMEAATMFQTTNYGGLSTLSTNISMVIEYLAVDGKQNAVPWMTMPSLKTIYSGFGYGDSTHGQILTWKDGRFDGGFARYCEMGSSVEVVLKGNLPAGCDLIDLQIIRPTSSIVT